MKLCDIQRGEFGGLRITLNPYLYARILELQLLPFPELEMIKEFKSPKWKEIGWLDLNKFQIPIAVAYCDEMSQEANIIQLINEIRGSSSNTFVLEGYMELYNSMI